MTGPLLRYCPPEMRSADIVAACFRVYWPNAETALDPTFGKGHFWPPAGERQVRVTGQDINGGPDGICDVRNLPYDSWEFDVVVFDPPHVADGGAEGIMANRYGTYTFPELERMVRAGCREVDRVGRLGCLIKVTDGVHGGKFAPMSRWVIEELGWPSDTIHSTRTRPLTDPKWGAQQHAYSNGSTYHVYRYSH